MSLHLAILELSSKALLDQRKPPVLVMRRPDLVEVGRIIDRELGFPLVGFAGVRGEFKLFGVTFRASA
jgi:hypothetical protein